MKKTLLTLAAAAAITTGAGAVMPATAQAGVTVAVHGDKYHAVRHRRCFVVWEWVRVPNWGPRHRHNWRRGWHWELRPVRICRPFRRW